MSLKVCWGHGSELALHLFEHCVAGSRRCSSGRRLALRCLMRSVMDGRWNRHNRRTRHRVDERRGHTGHGDNALTTGDDG